MEKELFQKEWKVNIDELPTYRTPNKKTYRKEESTKAKS